MSMIGNLFVRLGLNSSGFTNGLGQAQNQTSAFSRGISKIGGMIAGVFAVGKIVDWTRGIFDQTKKLDALSAGYKAVITNSSELKKVYQELDRMAETYGISINTLKTEYLGFAAASKGTALEGQKALKVFDAITYSMGKLGASEEAQHRALIAVTQMMSKGAVASEELRGQLGEALPGAFNMVARSMGITTQKLGKMLQMGQVMASDMLPKLADELNKTFGNSSRIETLTAAQGRYNTSITDFVKKLDSGDIFKSWYDSATKFMNKLGEIAASKEFQTSIKAWAKDFDDVLYVAMSKNITLWQKLGIMINKGLPGNSDESDRMIRRAKEADEDTQRQKEAIEATVLRSETLARLNDEYKKTKQPLVTPKELSDSEIYTLRIKQLTEEIKITKNALKFAKPTDDIGKLGDAFEEAKKKLLDFKKTYYDAAIKGIENAGNKQQLITDNLYLDGKTSKEQYEIDTLRLSIQTYNKEKEAAIRYGQEIVSIDDKIIKARLDLKEKSPEKMSRISNKASVKYDEVSGKDINGQSDPDQLKITPPTLDMIKAEETLASISSFNTALNSLLSQGLQDAAITFGEGLGELMSGDITVKDFGMTLLSVIGKFLVQFGSLMIAYAIAAAALTTTVSNPYTWPVALAAGIALVAVGTAISSLASKGLSGGSGGSGGSAGATGYSYQGGSSNINVGGEFELRGDKLIAVIGNTNRKNKNIS